MFPRRKWGRFSTGLLAPVAIIAIVVVTWFLPQPPLLEVYSFGTEIYDRNGVLIRLTTAEDERFRVFVPLEEISGPMVDTTLLYEDKYFWYHPGVNVVALVEAAIDTYFAGVRRGASTITMQLARMRFGIDSSSPLGKLYQIYLAFKLELHFTKEEILEAYFNLAPYGGNVEGIKAASLIYFHKVPGKLTQAEAILLSTIPQNPGKRRPSRGGEETDALFAARQRLARAWLEKHQETTSHQLGLNHRFRLGMPSELPFIAPHVTTALIAQKTRLRRIVTSIDSDIQKELARVISAYVERRRRVGIRNAAAMIVDHRSKRVVALVGSADFFDPKIDGQVNAATAGRSPGSALKPFVYALAIDQGLIHPASLLKDSPLSFAGYTPSNFDERFKGPLSATEALVRSRNIPALRLASALQRNGLYGLLDAAGVKGLRGYDVYGLPIVLGGVEVTMEELASLYASLESGGVVSKVSYEMDERDASDVQSRIMSPEAAFLTLEMLKKHRRPGQLFDDEWTRDSSPVAWKTGTSPGMRDAWSVGVLGPYVVVVWVGQFMGGKSPMYVGRRAAAPLFFEIVDSLRTRGFSQAPAQIEGLNLSRVDVCATSGALPSPHCSHTKKTWFIPGKSPIDRCTIHRQLEIDPRTGMRVCPEQAGTGRKQVFELWPSDLASLFEEAGLSKKPPPPFPSWCALETETNESVTLEITSPKSHLVYAVRSENTDEDNVPFRAVSYTDASSLFWFVDGEPVGRVAPGETLLWPSRPGSFTVAVLDDRGRNDSRSFRVELVE